MNAFGVFTINLLVNEGQRTKKIRLHSTRCFRDECSQICERFRAANPEIAGDVLHAVFSPQPVTIQFE